MPAPPRYHTIASELLARVPELRDAHRLSTYGGELMVTIFLGNAAAYVLDQARALARAASAERPAIEARIAAILDVVERALGDGDDHLQNVVSAAFIEELDTDDPALFRRVAERLGPAARREVRTLTKFYRSKEWLDFLKSR